MNIPKNEDIDGKYEQHRQKKRKFNLVDDIHRCHSIQGQYGRRNQGDAVEFLFHPSKVGKCCLTGMNLPFGVDKKTGEVDKGYSLTQDMESLV